MFVHSLCHLFHLSHILQVGPYGKPLSPGIESGLATDFFRQNLSADAIRVFGCIDKVFQHAAMRDNSKARDTTGQIFQLLGNVRLPLRHAVDRSEAVRHLDLYREAVAQERHGLLEELKVVVLRFAVAMTLNQNNAILQCIFILRQDVGNIEYRLELFAKEGGGLHR